MVILELMAVTASKHLLKQTVDYINLHSIPKPVPSVEWEDVKKFKESLFEYCMKVLINGKNEERDTNIVMYIIFGDTYKEVAVRYGMSEGYVRQIWERIISKCAEYIKHRLADKPTSIDEIGLPDRVLRGLYRAGIKPTTPVEDMGVYTSKDLLGIPYFGKLALEELQNKLSLYGVSLKEENN